MEAVLLGLGAALGFGTSDFLAGLLSRRVHYALVAVIGGAAAASLTIVSLLFSDPSTPTTQALVWGVISGIGGGFGVLILYRGLGRGRMGVVAPLSALGTAGLPVIVGVALGERPPIIAWIGVLLALPAIWLVSTSTDPENEETATGRAPLAEGVVDGLLAGVGFAVFLVGMGLAGDDAGLWPPAVSEFTSLVFVSVVFVGTLLRLEHRRLPAREIGGSLAVGLLAGVASILYLWSTLAGLLSIVAVISSLYPAATVVLSWAILHEAIGRRQLVGLVLAAVALVLIVFG
jgi:drug/metabolite transporter (DMT)-like permease